MKEKLNTQINFAVHMQLLMQPRGNESQSLSRTDDRCQTKKSGVSPFLHCTSVLEVSGQSVVTCSVVHFIVYMLV